LLDTLLGEKDGGRLAAPVATPLAAY